jgi:hypothetical protein
MVKKGDIIMISVLILTAVCSFLFVFFFKAEGKTVVIKENNTEIASVSLYEDKTVELEGNTVVIKNGECYVSYASCPDKICKNHKKISRKGESIICLPNKVSVEIK